MYELLALHTVVPISKHGRRFDEQSANLCRHSRIRRASQLILNECLQGFGVDCHPEVSNGRRPAGKT